MLNTLTKKINKKTYQKNAVHSQMRQVIIQLISETRVKHEDCIYRYV